MWQDYDSGYVLGTTESLTFIIQKDFAGFKSVHVDGEQINRDTDYQAKSGSTLITLLPDYLSGLAEGQHDLLVTYTDGVQVPTTFTIYAAGASEPPPSVPTTAASSSDTAGSAAPGTGSNGQNNDWLLVLAAMLALFGGAALFRARSRIHHGIGEHIG